MWMLYVPESVHYRNATFSCGKIRIFDLFRLSLLFIYCVPCVMHLTIHTHGDRTILRQSRADV